MIIVEVNLKDWGLDSRLIRDGWMNVVLESYPHWCWMGGQGQLRPIEVYIGQVEVVHFVMSPDSELFKLSCLLRKYSESASSQVSDRDKDLN